MFGTFLKKDFKQKTIKGVLWSSVERFSVQGAQFVFSILFARLLVPEDYGVIGMIGVFLAISQSLINSGFANALIQKKNRTETDYSTVFYFNIFAGIFFYFLLFFFSPHIALFYNMPSLSTITKVVALELVFNSLSIVQRAKLSIELNFKSQAKAGFISTILSGLAGLFVAYHGFGVWALVVQSVSGTFISTALLFIIVRWKPLPVFSKESFSKLFSFGSKLLAAGLIETLYNNVHTLVIAKKYNASDLGIYSKSDKLTSFMPVNLTGILQKVTFPLLSSIQDDKEQLIEAYRKYLRLSAFITFPLLLGLAAIAKPFVVLLLTEKWIEIIPLLQLLCLSYIWHPVHVINLNLLQVTGRPDLFLRLEIIKKVLGILILIVTLPFGIKALCAGKILSGFISLFINTYYTGKFFALGFVKQLKDLFPTLLCSLSMAFVSYTICNLFPKNNFLSLLLGIISGIFYYFIINIIFKSKELKTLMNIFRGL